MATVTGGGGRRALGRAAGGQRPAASRASAATPRAARRRPRAEVLRSQASQAVQGIPAWFRFRALALMGRHSHISGDG